jgi:plastocyanin
MLTLLLVFACDGPVAPDYQEPTPIPLDTSQASPTPSSTSTSTSSAPKDAGAAPKGTSDASSPYDAASSPDAQPTEDGSIADAPADAVQASDAPVSPNLNGCTSGSYDNETGTSDDREIRFPYDSDPDPYSTRCMKIRVGQSVTWKGAFAYHPLEAFGGSTPSPITYTSTGTAKAFTFTAVGVFGFHNPLAPTKMRGAIQVVP